MNGADDTSLNAAVLLLGAEAGHALLGCDWGTRIATPDDLALCTRQARQIVALHRGPDVLDVKVCLQHRARLYTETDPRGTAAS